ncbi:hypothetical protein [Azospirillum sp. SYSU D00513]|uniref:hypothetical protein n=1 Tax=Azospirillum sp. SYSU D00513 TaxID=2812561 RepID=UPI001A97B493|nr:hypothetical protein [Azospirillum sp. SYSU D00513]
MIMVAEHDEALLRVGHRFGSRHPLTLCAAGVTSAIHSPDRPRTGFEACIGVVAMDDLNTEVAIAAVMSAAGRLAVLTQP